MLPSRCKYFHGLALYYGCDGSMSRIQQYIELVYPFVVVPPILGSMLDNLVYTAYC